MLRQVFSVHKRKTKMTRRFVLTLLIAAATFSFSFSSTSFAEPKPLKVHVISGSKEYQSEPSLKAFMPWLAKNYHVKWTASWGTDGIKKLDNLNELKTADVMLVYARRMKLSEAQMKIIRAHWMNGKAIVGLRTASHAFSNDDNKVFDLKVMGGNYKGHYGNEPVKVIAAKDAKTHPILKGVGAFISTKLYKAGELAASAKVLQFGDIGKDKHAVTWVNEYKGGRVFYSSLGVPSDFQDDQFKTLLANAIFWTAKQVAAKMKK